jgi:outer membrane biosynthesis protein TonB
VASYVGLHLPFPDRGHGPGNHISTDPASPAPAGAGRPTGAGHSQRGGDPSVQPVPASTDDGPEAGSSSGPGQAVVSDNRPQTRPPTPAKKRVSDPDDVDNRQEQPADPGEPTDPRETEPAAPVEPSDPIEVEPPPPAEPRDPSEPRDPPEPAEGSGSRRGFTTPEDY